MRGSPRRVFAFVGATMIGTLAVLAALELVSWAAWSFAQWLRPDPLRPEMSPAYVSAEWVPDLFREQSLRLASPYTYFPFRITGVTPWHGSTSTTMNTQPESGAGRSTPRSANAERS